ncbi:VTT domain-containing protein [Kineosporia sp. J2-2]|uniref:VTT domain-containing protein n=1 Tax=Kineosporia corallincola TaxID=2835133 RepID=A0ABS5TMF8_9ACTN|nr:VTT domain-containing protein [Kineosporia corallincola]MBT0772028.1 VTT domain-containing protein [Kineosporia corallincola]
MPAATTLSDGTVDATTSLGLATLAGLFLTVTLGAIVPVVPTGAAVSGVGAFAWHHDPLLLVLVLTAGAAGAYLGDLGMYALCRVGGRALARRLRWLRDDDHLGAVEERLHRNPVQTLLVSRLLPGGRIPVLLAAAFLGLDWRTFLVANAPACALWSAVYLAVGTVGGSVFAEPWQGVLAAVVLVLVATQAAGLVSRYRLKHPGARS